MKKNRKIKALKALKRALEGTFTGFLLPALLAGGMAGAIGATAGVGASDALGVTNSTVMFVITFAIMAILVYPAIGGALTGSDKLLEWTLTELDK